MSLRRTSPAADRNKDPILTILKQTLKPKGHALVIAAGTGQHTAHFAEHFTNWSWQPTDFDDQNLSSIDDWSKNRANVKPAIQLDVRDDWPTMPITGVFNANMIHISPWSTCIGLMRNAGMRLDAEQPLIMYGPFKEKGQHTSSSNAQFDDNLKYQDLSWGVRNIEDVEQCANENGLLLIEKYKMPANNLTLIFRKG